MMVPPGIKQTLIYGAFGILLGSKLVEMMTTGGHSLLDWWVLLLGLGAAIVHYLPAGIKNSASEHDGYSAQGRSTNHFHSEPEEELVLHNHPHAERGKVITGHPQSLEGREALLPR